MVRQIVEVICEVTIVFSQALFDRKLMERLKCNLNLILVRFNKAKHPLLLL